MRVDGPRGSTGSLRACGLCAAMALVVAWLVLDLLIYKVRYIADKTILEPANVVIAKAVVDCPPATSGAR
jgi:hypothetical protein